MLEKQYSIQRYPRFACIEVYTNSHKSNANISIYITSQNDVVIYDENSTDAYKVAFYEPDFEQLILDTIRNLTKSEIHRSINRNIWTS